MLQSNKRNAVDFESPDAACKRRRMYGAHNNAPVPGPFFGNNNGNNLTPFQNNNSNNAQQNVQNNYTAGMNKRRRQTDDDGAMNEVAALRAQLEQMHHQLQERELVNMNLKQACENQQSELVKMHNENKLLKRSVVAFNDKREKAEHVAAQTRERLAVTERRVRELEETNLRLLYHAQQQSLQTCRNDNFHDHNPFSGGGPVC
mmetsp:Transcript_7311/g.14574  ORF Transcript_7311/g.14574 Transcript_7311/m.14574 type:complete len:203 (-) Transcript_7311:131-739(-)|eukprot:CAMPEP_0171496912 /NCGR_PEP_ID=MMETSP0958-20121227/6968_1 /TAXON_ID=87120 /ORGANISM="Aurantiochytrium limacinum, Strain ATCCMYA-1381" /LENGTH=202 /DNA_ID=CAMNT_0012031073 /DNA_START=1139 /DNA_END=1747 /DNA_ORIENTATION=+